MVKTISMPDRKRLWALSGGICAKCNNITLTDGPRTNALFGDEAHISGEKPKSARYDSQISDEERAAYSNRILLCRNCHKTVDDDAIEYTVSKLHSMKDSIEKKNAETTIFKSKVKMADDQLIAQRLEDIERLCRFDIWGDMTLGATNAKPWWIESKIDNIREAIELVSTSSFSNPNEELPRSILTFVESIDIALSKFEEHCDSTHDASRLSASHPHLKTYNTMGHESSYYNWVDECIKTIYFATASANWMIDTVQKEFDPNFRNLNGFLTVNQWGPQGIMYTVPHLQDCVKGSLPGKINLILKGYGQKQVVPTKASSTHSGDTTQNTSPTIRNDAIGNRKNT